MNTSKNTLRRLAHLLKLPTACLLLLATLNCASPTSTSCTTTSTDFSQLYSQAVALPGHVDTNTFDTEIHEYTFTFSQSKTICSIGYQSQPAVASVPYLIELKNNTTNTILYSASHVFSSTNTSYVSITPTILVAGQSYTIRRTLLLTNAGNLASNLIGRVVRQNGALVTFPKTFGLMTITGARFFQNGGPLVDTGIPFIDIAYY
jgi:hypothetical protein